MVLLYYTKGIFPSDNPKWQVPICAIFQQAMGAERCGLGNCTFVKLAFGKIPLGKYLTSLSIINYIIIIVSITPGINQPRTVRKSGHNIIEKRYRSSINEK